MTLIPQTGNPHTSIEKQDIILHGAEVPIEYRDAAALAMVVQNAAKAEQWLDSQAWKMQWRETDILYQSPRTSANFENSTVTRANVSKFTVAKHVNSLVPTMMSGIFYDPTPFLLRPLPGTSEATARARTAVIAKLLRERKMGFKAECEKGVESQCLNGTGLFEYGWETCIRKKKKFVRKKAAPKLQGAFGEAIEVPTTESDEFAVEERTIEENRAFFESCELGTILVDPKWREANEIWRAEWIIKRRYLNFRQLDQLRQQKGYKIPSQAALEAAFFPPAETPQAPSGVELGQQDNSTVHHAAGRDDNTNSINPLHRVLKVDAWYDDDVIIVVVQDKLIIRNEQHGFDVKPFLSSNWWNIQCAGYGMGVGRLIGSEQRVEQGVTCAALDILSYAVNPSYARTRTANVPAQQIRTRLAGIIDIDGKVGDAFGLVETPKVPSEVFPVLAHSKQTAESTTGADEAFGQGSLPGRGNSSAARTATGAGGIITARAERIQGPLGRFIDNVFIPFIIALDEMIRERMPIAEIRAILGEAGIHDLDMDEFLNGELDCEVLAGAMLAAKKAMWQSLPLIIQIFENPHLIDSLNAMGWTVDIKELFEMLMEMSEWKNTRDVIRQMSPDEQKSYVASKQGPQMEALMNKLREISAKHGGKMEEIDRKGEIDMAKAVVDKSFDHAGEVALRQNAEGALKSAMAGA